MKILLLKDAEAVDFLHNKEIHEKIFLCIEHIGLHYSDFFFFLISFKVLEVQYIKLRKGSLTHPFARRKNFGTGSPFLSP